MLAAAAVTAPTPSPTPAADSCATQGRTNLLAAINRPTVGYSACAVKPREALIELGFANQSGDAPAVQYPQGFLRLGIAQSVEVDLIGPAYQLGRDAGAPASGFFDSGVGAKWEIAHDERGALAVDALYTVPTGAAPLSAGKPTETLNADYARSLSAAIGIATTVGVERGFAGTTLLPSLVLTDQFSSRAQTYAEAFAQSKTRPDGGALFGLDAGLQYEPAPQIEVDVEAGRTITDRSRNHYYGFGLGWRL